MFKGRKFSGMSRAIGNACGAGNTDFPIGDPGISGIYGLNRAKLGAESAVVAFG